MAQFSPSPLNTFLGKLSNDHIFRAQLLEDPVAALSGLGLTVDAAQIPALRSLPSADVIASDRAAVLSKLDGVHSALPFKLTAAN